MGIMGIAIWCLDLAHHGCFTASSVFIKQVEVKDYDKKGVFLYEFSEKPELSSEKNWSVSNYVIVASYSKKVFSLWLNKGSKIRIRWEAQTSSLGQLEVSIIKGEQKYKTLIPKSTDGREAEYVIEEDDKYCLGIVNTNPRSIIMAMNVNVSSKMYDTTKAKSMCSTIKGSCRLSLLFPYSQFVTVTTPNNGELEEWHVKLSFVARVMPYIASLGFVVIIIFLIHKYLRACDGDTHKVTETDPLVAEKPFQMPYGTGEADVESGSSTSPEDFNDGKICVICNEERQNCFFVPCGHCTCYTCAKRIMDGETKKCPICKRNFMFERGFMGLLLIVLWRSCTFHFLRVTEQINCLGTLLFGETSVFWVCLLAIRQSSRFMFWSYKILK
ncbi:E3 ubiquitin-protein ligase APD1-like isoform X2 [Actinidia eriantha]|uniref:E3 ubiquitin-protein ligase APD1-like isoform X2 n=1 Tax=Actinidia eriantha TaxID=165200 RepID=UPI0025861583|nr:E3 ubiquitin-protein ligase APD1-like isoform X2 [Actinidia eriantha]